MRSESIFQEPGEHLARFRFSAMLGHGATSVVYAAHDRRRDRAVALKIFRRTAEPAHKGRFLREGFIAATVRHHNVAEVVEVIESSRCGLLVMELVNGKTLRAHLNEIAAAKGHMQRCEAARIAEHVCCGLAAVHQAGIIHCDIKPENILLSNDGEIKLIDFGIARKYFSSEPRAPSTEQQGGFPNTDTTAVRGTPGYMSPEQANSAPLDARADLFSLGVVLYEMLAGSRPFTGPSAAAVQMEAERAEPVPPSQHRRSVDPRIDLKLDRVILRCLEKNPRSRQADAIELHRELQALTRLMSAPEDCTRP